MDVEAEQRDPLEMLAADFAERYRQGQSPSIADYAQRHPELAADIQELFPTIAVMERLKAHHEAGSGPRASLGAVRLERLGDFRILAEIGRGGMGIVYEAFQESLGRHVAVKVLPRQSLLDSKHLQRFRREAQTAARLHHTNIVPVFGVGECDGFHYIVMQLIRGVGLDALLATLQQSGPCSPALSLPAGAEMSPAESKRVGEVVALAQSLVSGQMFAPHAALDGALDDADDANADAQQAAASPLPRSAAATEEFTGAQSKAEGAAGPATAGPAPAPPHGETWQIGPPYWRSAALLAQQVAEALQYAHAHHTLHRDIKPANLLLDAQGVVWITDFGLAKAMEQENLTQGGILVGTLCYMAPEQFSGQADARSDIYSLGLTVYELLTLRPAFVQASRSGLIAKVARDEPPGPRKINPQIPRDLETIVLKAIARDPADRYQTAGEMARDLECFLDDRPIRARRTPPLERLWRWARRNRTVAGLTASTLLLLLAVALVASTGYVRTTRANREESRQRKKAEATSALALEALDNIFQQFAPDRSAPASTLLLVGDKGEQITVPVQPVLSKEAASLLEHMLAFYDRLAAQGGDDAKLRRKVAEANRRVGDIRQRLGQYDESKAAYLRAIDLYTKVAAADQNADYRMELARLYNELGSVYSAGNVPDQARQSHLSALAALAVDSADLSASPQSRYELARTYYFLGKRFGAPAGLPPLGPAGRHGMHGGGPGPGHDFGRHPDGPPGPPPGEPQFAHDQPPPGPPFDEHHFGHDQPPPGSAGFHVSPEEAEANLQKAITILQPLVAEHPTTPDYRHLLARCYRELSLPNWGHAPAGAPDPSGQATALLEELVREYPDVPDYRYDLCETYAWLGAMPFTPQAADAAAVQRSSTLLEKALAISEELVAEHPNIPDYALSQVHIRLRLAETHWESAPALAEAGLRKALELQTTLARRFPQNSFYQLGMGVIGESLAALMQQQGRLREARSALQDSIAVLKRVLQSDPQAGPLRGALGHQTMNLAELLQSMGEEKGAAEARREAEKLRESEPRNSGTSR